MAARGPGVWNVILNLLGDGLRDVFDPRLRVREWR